MDRNDVKDCIQCNLFLGSIDLFDDKVTLLRSLNDFRCITQDLKNVKQKAYKLKTCNKINVILVGKR